MMFNPERGLEVRLQTRRLVCRCGVGLGTGNSSCSNHSVDVRRPCIPRSRDQPLREQNGENKGAETGINLHTRLMYYSSGLAQI